MIIAHGPYIVLPYIWNAGDATKNTKLLDAFEEHPIWFTTALTPKARRVSAAQGLADPSAKFWEVWHNKDFVGIFLLQHIVPECDALFHFMFLDGRFRGRRDLILAFFGRVFETYGLQRLTMHVPDFRGKYLDWVRLKLGFKWEGEATFAALPGHQQDAIREAIGQKPASWLASIGSRREKTHFHDGEFHDTYVVRLLREDFYDMMQPKEAQCPGKPLPRLSPEA